MTPDAPLPDGPIDPAEPELMDDGQEEVFSHTAVELGLVKDPTALDPATFKPLSPHRLSCADPEADSPPEC